MRFKIENIAAYLLLIGLCVLFGLSSGVVHDFDLFWQLQSGRFMHETGQVIRSDVFSLASQVPRQEHCWLHDLIVYWIWLGGGYVALSIFKGILITLTAVVTIATARIRGSSWLSCLLLIPTPILFTKIAWAGRPHLWSFFCFSLFLFVLEKYRTTENLKVLYYLIPIMVLWTNLHAGAMLGVAVFGAYTFGMLGSDILKCRIRKTLSNARGLGLVLFGLMISLFLTPYASWLLVTAQSQIALVLPAGTTVNPVQTTTVNTVQTSSAGLMEGNLTLLYNMDWRSTSEFLAQDPRPVILMGIAVFMLLFGWRRLVLSDFLLLGGVMLMGLKLYRHLPFFYLGFAALIPVYLDSILKGFSIPRWINQSGQAALLALAVLLTIYSGEPIWKAEGLLQVGLREWHFPVDAARFIEKEQLPGNLYNTYDWGGYLMWTLYPKYKVFWDGRQSSDEMFRHGLEVMRGDKGWQQILQKFDVNTIVTRTCTIDTGQHYPLLDRLKTDSEWALVYAGDTSLIFVRKKSVSMDWLQKHSLSMERIDETILSEAALLTASEPRRYMAWWEMANIYLQRRQYKDAFPLLRKHLVYAPEGQYVPAADRYYRILYPMMQKP